MYMPNYARTEKAKQNQRVAVVSDESEGLPKLTLKQEQFALALMQGKTGVEAYITAYTPKCMSKEAIAVEASRLRRNTKIVAFMRALQRIGLENQAVTRENHLSEMARLREIAVSIGQISAGVQAEHHRGKVAGLYEDKLDIRLVSDETIVSQLQAILGHELASAMGTALGIETGLERPGNGSQTKLLSRPSPLEDVPPAGHGQDNGNDIDG